MTIISVQGRLAHGHCSQLFLITRLKASTNTISTQGLTPLTKMTVTSQGFGLVRLLYMLWSPGI
uniref:Uncharacterized protein n=1 Tax=Timema cristinae TaxID=61476 RepID=A0A7R9CGK6_TIMCR|nr:unnamed protein product [Timema cristinae]